MSRAANTPLFTIGYEHATSPAVLDAIEQAGVQILVDVRAVAASRRPGFSKRQLAAGLDERGVAYLHLRALGTPKEGRLAARSGHHEDMLRIYDAHIATPSAREELDALTALARSGKRLCLLCYEREPEHCHRLRLAQIVSKTLKMPVEHLFAMPA